MSSSHSPHLTEEDESYFVSMTDLMVGMLFVFIIILMAFALNFREAEQKQDQINQELTGAREARQQMLQDISHFLERRGVRVEIDSENGVLRLKADLLFERGQSHLSEQGEMIVAHVADALWVVLPCYSNAGIKPQGCPSFKGGRLEAIFIEGHTDNDPFAKGALKNNWILSAERAISTFKYLVAMQGGLEDIKNDESLHLLGVSGYAERRPTEKVEGQTEAAKKQADRRIDLRFIMASPKPEPLKATAKAIGEEQPQ